MSHSNYTVISSDQYNPLVENNRYFNNNSYPVYHEHSHQWLLRYANGLKYFRDNHPNLSQFLSVTLPLLFAASIPFVWMALPTLFSLAASTLLTIQIATSVVSGIALIISGASIWVANYVLGDNLEPGKSIYTSASDSTSTSEKKFTYETAKGTLSVQTNQLPNQHRKLPKLTIEADNHYHAGYVEGYMQGEQIEKVLESLDNLYRKIRIFIGAPNDEELDEYLKEIEAKIPKNYKDEMNGKVDGYNKWRSENKRPESGNLEYYKYLLLQLLPDAHHYNPFKQPVDCENPTGVPTFGCTSVAFKVFGYTCYTRVLDWPGYGIAGESFIEIERRIQGTKPTTDVSLCLLSGAITSLNSDKVLTQINVSRVEKVGAQGMPGVFAIRYLSEQCDSVKSMQTFLQKSNDPWFGKGPLSGMHISATDGTNTLSYHAYQNPDIKGGHIIETLGDDRPLVVANFGLNPETKALISHCNSSERLENINAFFHTKDERFYNFGQLLEDEKLKSLQTFMLEILRLPLVNNFESVYAAMYIYKAHDKAHELLAALAATNNGFAGSREIEDFYQLTGAPSLK